MGCGQRPGEKHLHWLGGRTERIARALQDVQQRILHRGAQAGRDAHVDDLVEKIALFRGGFGADQRVATITKFCRMASFGCAPRVLGPIGTTVDFWIGRQCIGDLRGAGAQQTQQADRREKTLHGKNLMSDSVQNLT
ncbi:hypothetical protein D3C87_1576100 [compost metagenome]